MKKTIALFTALLCTALLLAGCDTASGPDAETTGKKKEVKLKEFTYEEIYCSPRYENDYVSPVLQQVLTYPAQDALYVYAGSAVSDAKPLWHSIYTREDGTLSVLHDPFCYDPLCSHDDATCLAYATKGKTKVIPFEDKLYLISMGSKSKTSNFIEYSLSSGKYNIIDSYETGGQMITRMGRFVYFTERNVTGQDDTGKLEYVLALHRYDLESGKTDYLGTIPGNRDFLKPTAYNGEIYYIDAYELYKCDYNLRYAQKISGNHKVKIFEIRDNTVWFLTETKDKRGGLYRRDLSGGETELVYEDVTWFSLDGDTLYYSLYDPVDAFEWDIWMQTKDGNGKMLVTEMITVHNGNKVYRISLDKAGKKGAEAPFCKALPENGIYLSDAYAVYNGMMICDFRGPYSDGSRKGLSSGKAVIRAETGEIIRITSEDFFLDGQVFPYKEQTES